MKTISVSLLFFFLAIIAHAQTDTVGIEKNNLRTDYLKEGTSQFAVWSKNESTGKVSRLILWERIVAFTKNNGIKIVTVSQRRLYEDTIKNTYVYTISERATFRTIYDYRRDKTGIQSFDYKDKQILGSDTITNNIKAGFSLSLPVFPYCFELDIETLSMLPIDRTGQKFAINFYHPGGSVPPKYYPVTVVKEDNLNSESGAIIKCWVIRLDYDDKNYDLSWISESTHTFIKLESHSPGSTFNKVRLYTSVKTF